jgi:hypothetical protein
MVIVAVRAVSNRRFVAKLAHSPTSKPQVVVGVEAAAVSDDLPGAQQDPLELGILASKDDALPVGGQRQTQQKVRFAATGLCEELLALDRKLADMLAGKLRPKDPAEQLALADLCREYKKLNVAATRFYMDAFAGDAHLADAMTRQLNSDPKAADQVLARLKHWEKDPDLTDVRKQPAPATLSDDQRQAQQRLWADVGALANTSREGRA